MTRQDMVRPDNPGQPLKENLMTRRDIVRTLAACTAMTLSGIRSNSLLGQSHKPLLGFSTYGMKTLPVREAISHIGSIGFKAVEITVMPTWPTDPKLVSKSERAEIRKQIGDLGLVLCSLQESLQLEDPNTLGNPNYSKKEKLERLREAAAMAHEASPGPPALIETALGGQAAQWEGSKQEMADELGTWAKTLEPLKTVLAIKGFVGSVVDRPERLLWLLDQVKSPWIQCGYDYSHFKLLGLDQRKTMLQLASHLVFIHVKDSVGTAEKYRFQLPGDSGEINYKSYSQVVSEIGYSGPIVVEVSIQVSSQPGYNGVAAAKHAFENLAPFFG
jgi:sugar phosphate isomerase/epimerase